MLKFRPGILIPFCAFFLQPFSALNAQAQSLEWQPILRFQGELFPSFILANATRTLAQKVPTAFGDLLGSVGISLKSPRTGARAKAAIEIDGVAEESYIEETLPEAGTTYLLLPRLRYDYARLLTITQPITTTVRYQIFIDGEKLVDDARPIRVLSVNDVPIATYKAGKLTNDYSYMFAAYVNENHPVIENILRGALNLPQPIVNSFSGYQGDVFQQVFAIWYFLQRNQFAYTSITTPSAVQDGVATQHVRFLQDSIRVRQANCIDGTVVFASILRKIGIDPLIVLIPGHAFLGFYTNQQHSQLAFLETTMLTGTNPFANRPPSKLGTVLARAAQFDPHESQSASVFNAAVEYANQNYEKVRSALSAHEQHYAIIDIAKVREAGVQPISR